MQVGTYADGRALDYNEATQQFTVGDAQVTYADVAGYERVGQITWLSDEIRTWASAVTAGATTQPAAPGTDGGSVTQPVRPGRLLGFRSKTTWKMVVAGLYYAFCAITLLGVFTSVKPYATGARDVALDVLSYLLMILALIAPPLLLSEFSYRDKLPLFKERKLVLSVVGLVAVFFMVVATSALADSLHTKTYKVAAKSEAAADDRKAEAARRAQDADAARAAEAKRKADAASRAQEESRAAAARAVEASRAAEASAAAAARQASAQAAADAAAAEAKKKNQQLYLAFESDFYAAESAGINAARVFQKKAAAFDSGDASLLDVYESAVNAQRGYESAQFAYFDIDTPGALPKEVRAILDDAKSNASTACMLKKEAFKAFAEYLDTQEMSQIQKYKDKIASADQQTLAAVAGLLQAREKLGLPLEGPK